MPSCFISHAWGNGGHDFAMKLGAALRKNDITIWLDENEIWPGDDIKTKIRKGIEYDSDVFLFVLTPESIESQMCLHELDLALRQRNEYCKPIIPVFFKECTIPDFLKNICYADFREQLSFDASIERLIKGIIESIKIRGEKSRDIL